jgi:hypothetical protein
MRLGSPFGSREFSAFDRSVTSVVLTLGLAFAFIRSRNGKVRRWLRRIAAGDRRLTCIAHVGTPTRRPWSTTLSELRIEVLQPDD